MNHPEQGKLNLFAVRGVIQAALAAGALIWTSSAVAAQFGDLVRTVAPGWQGQIVAEVPQSYCGWGVTIGDADNDGKNEILATGSPDSRLYLFRREQGVWHTRQLADNLAERTPGMGLCVKVLDLNGDRRNEVILGTGQDGGGSPARFYVMQTDGRTITSKAVARALNPDSAYTHNFGCYDLNGDGVQEVISAYCGTGEIVRYDIARDLGSISAATVHNNPGSGEDAWIADVDNDGHVEFITASGYRVNNGTVRIFDFDAAGRLQAQPRIIIDGYDGKRCFLGTIAVGDVDNDGKQEMVVGWSQTNGDGKGTIIGYKVQGANATPAYTFAHEDPAMGRGYFGQLMQVADANNDGKNDLVVTVRNEPDEGSTTPPSPTPTAAFLFDVNADNAVQRTLLAEFKTDVAQSCWPVVGDADNDGRNELVLATGYGDRRQPGTSYIVAIKPIPEPGSIALMATGAIALFGYACWKRRGARALRTAAVMAAILGLGAASQIQAAEAPAAPSCVRPRDFSWAAVKNPENLFYPAYLWLWNGPLEPTVLQQQLGDMAAHDARNVCVLPMPHEFRPTTMNSQMDVEYLSPAYFDRVRTAVGEASRLGMNYWLYDEGGWPSGQAAGRVLQTRPASAAKVMKYAGGAWTQQTVSGVDLLDPQTTQTFLTLTHQRYADAIGSHFGNTVKLTFTDEPAYSYPQPGGTVPWTAGADDLFRNRFGYSLQANLGAFQVTNPAALTAAQKQVRVDALDFWSGQFRDAYFQPIRDWDHQHGLASGGHLGGEDKTLGASTHGYGSILRQLRAMDVPGIDTIYRQIFPGQATENNFPKFASSSAHYNGTSLVMSESFCVAGNGLTPAQMKWVTDYERVRGVTLQVNGCYPLSTKDHWMAGERPHFGAVNPLWDFLPDLHRYTARVDQVLASGQPGIDTALYYPVRDIWANGSTTDPALAGFNRLTQALLERQCDYDVIDDDVLNDPSTRVENGRLVLGAMTYRTIVVGPNQWMTDLAKQRLAAFETAGGQVVRIGNVGQIDAAITGITPTIALSVASPGIRAVKRSWDGGGAVFLFNEGQAAYKGVASIKLDGTAYEIDPTTGVTRPVSASKGPDGRIAVSLNLKPGQSMLLVTQPPQEKPDGLAPPTTDRVVHSLALADGWAARVDRQYVVGQHDFEIHERENPQFQAVTLGRWASTLGLSADFSGHVTYRKTVTVPEAMRGGRLVLDLGGLEYAARVKVDGEDVGCVLWSPWTIELPSLGDRTQFVLDIEMSNTLANELTSSRVRDAWGAMTGDGWPGYYNAGAWALEADSRGGGLLGPVSLHMLAVPEPSPLAGMGMACVAACIYRCWKSKFR